MHRDGLLAEVWRRQARLLSARVLFAAVIVLIACGAGPIGCRIKPDGKSQQPVATDSPRSIAQDVPGTEETGWLTIRQENRPLDSLMAVKPENLPAHVRSLYRIRPDRRFLYAAAEVERLTTGGSRRGTMTIRFEEGRWRLSLDGSPFGDLPEFPSFADAKSLLVSWLRARPGFTASVTSANAEPLDAASRTALESGSAAEVFSALARLNAKWTASPGDPTLAGAGLRGLLWLSLQTFDELQLGDPILGKALALLAIAEARTPGQLVREECLLATRLGYEDHAKLLARDLPLDDAVRRFADWDLAGLEELAHRPHADSRAEYFYLLRLAYGRANDEPWLRELESSSWGRQVDGPSLRLVLTLDPFDLRLSPASLMEWQVLEDLLPESRVAGAFGSAKGGPAWREIASQRLEALRRSGQKAPESRLSELEQAVDRKASSLDGPLLDREVVRAFHLAGFYSSIYAAARYYLDRLASTDGAEAYANSLGTPPAGTAAELKDWILHRVQLRRSSDGLRGVAADLSRLRHIGVAPLRRISYSLSISGDTTGLIRRAAAPGFFGALDTRPSNLHAAARASSELLSDLAIMEQCLRLATERAPRTVGRDLPWAFRFLGDRAALRKLTEDKTWPMAVRSSATQELARLEKLDPGILLDRLREMVREDPSDAGPLWAAVGILEEREQFEGASRLVDEWLEAHAERDLIRASVTSLKSRLLRKRGRFQEAWPIARAAAETWKGDCLEEAALALIDLSRLDEALQMARRMLDRYGGDEAAALVARILWMKGKDGEAGRLLTSSERRLSASSWSGIVPSAFFEAFKKANDKRAEAAFLELNVPSIPTLNLVWFVGNLTGHGRAELAVKLCEHLKGRGPKGWVAIATYHALGKAQGPAAARDWLRSNADPADMDIAAKQALQEEDYELLWDLPDHPDPTKNEILYLLRAAALLHEHPASEDRRKRLITYFETRPKKDFVVYGLFLLGQIDRATLFAEIKDPSYVCSIGWILGLTSAHEGRYEEANEWLQVSMEAGADIPPRIWASIILGRWHGSGGDLAEVARKGIY